MKVIFLDFDGVLNSAEYDRERDWSYNTNIDESRLPYLKRIIDATQAVIVLSTTWRKHWNKQEKDCDEVGAWINRTFAKYGMQIYGKTPILEHRATRKQEVLGWLAYPPEPIESFIMLDDEIKGWEELGDRLVRTSRYKGRGLEEEHVLQAIELLNRE